MTEKELIEKMKSGSVLEAKISLGWNSARPGYEDNIRFEIDGLETSITWKCIEVSLWLGHLVVADSNLNTLADSWIRYGLPE